MSILADQPYHAWCGREGTPIRNPSMQGREMNGNAVLVSQKRNAKTENWYLDRIRVRRERVHGISLSWSARSFHLLSSVRIRVGRPQDRLVNFAGVILVVA